MDRGFIPRYLYLERERRPLVFPSRSWSVGIFHPLLLRLMRRRLGFRLSDNIISSEIFEISLEILEISSEISQKTWEILSGTSEFFRFISQPCAVCAQQKWQSVGRYFARCSRSGMDFPWHVKIAAQKCKVFFTHKIYLGCSKRRWQQG